MSSDRFDLAPLECCVRTALELGELSPGLEMQIEQWQSHCNLSERDRALLEILYGALADGCIRRVSA
jgi:hypothetical protein